MHFANAPRDFNQYRRVYVFIYIQECPKDVFHNYAEFQVPIICRFDGTRHGAADGGKHQVRRNRGQRN